LELENLVKRSEQDRKQSLIVMSSPKGQKGLYRSVSDGGNKVDGGMSRQSLYPVTIVFPDHTSDHDIKLPQIQKILTPYQSFYLSFYWEIGCQI
jgi:hypothetical protein